MLPVTRHCTALLGGAGSFVSFPSPNPGNMTLRGGVEGLVRMLDMMVCVAYPPLHAKRAPFALGLD